MTVIVTFRKQSKVVSSITQNIISQNFANNEEQSDASTKKIYKILIFINDLFCKCH